MGFFDKLRGKNNKEAVEISINPTLIDMLSTYVGKAHQRQLAFGEQIVRGRNWNVDLDKGVIFFGEDKYPIQLLGTESQSSGTWLWGFANPSNFPQHVLMDSQRAYAFCKHIPELASEELSLTDLINGHNISSVSTAVRSDRVCYYRCPYDGGAAYVLVGDVPESVFASVEATKIINIISGLISQFPLNHKLLVKNLMEINCSEIIETDITLKGHDLNKAELTVSFDNEGRIASMNTSIAT